MQNSRNIHREAVCRILTYLKKTDEMGVLYNIGVNLNIVSYSDADLVDSKADKRSIDGYCTFLAI